MKIDGTRRHDRATEVVLAYYAAFNRGDWDGMLALLTDDVVHDLNQGRREQGREAFAAFLARMDAHYSEQLHDIVVMASPDGERAADSLFYLAQALQQLKKPSEACDVYAELEEVYPSRISASMKADITRGRAAASTAAPVSRPPSAACASAAARAASTRSGCVAAKRSTTSSGRPAVRRWPRWARRGARISITDMERSLGRREGRAGCRSASGRAGTPRQRAGGRSIMWTHLSAGSDGTPIAP